MSAQHPAGPEHPASPEHPAARQRLDAALVARGLAASRNRAAREIAAGHVRVDGRVARKPAEKVGPDARIELTEADPWVARSAHKLLGALEDFDLAERPAGAVCLDAGASTGGFTQVLLACGAAHVYAVDVGHDQLDGSLRADPRVSDLSGTNLRHLRASDLPPITSGAATASGTGAVSTVRPSFIVADVSFISLTLLIGPLLELADAGADLLLMVKPQFEAGRSALDKHGVVTDPAVRAAAVAQVAAAAAAAGAHVHGQRPSRLPGPAGNQEFFLHLSAPGDAR